MTVLALYKGSGRWTDRLVRLVTRSEYSHCELLEFAPNNAERFAWRGRSWSASGRDGGVRGKVITFTPGRWSFVSLPWAPKCAVGKIAERTGASYDYLGLLGSQFFNLGRHSSASFFCSEICGYALGLSRPHELSPGSLHRRALEMNNAFFLGAGKPPEERARNW